MILQSLARYYSRLSSGASGEVAGEGFQKKEIPFVIVLGEDGSFSDLEDTRDGEGRKKKARVFMVPREVKRSGKNAWQRANLLWDNPGYVLAYPGDDKAVKQHGSFKALIEEKLAGLDDAGLIAVRRFLGQGDFSAVFEHPLWPDVSESGGNMSFRLKGDTCLVVERPDLSRHLADSAGSEQAGCAAQACLITGEPDIPAALHAAIKGVYGANSTGANVVSFNLPAFTSHGKEQGGNAPIGKRAEFAYTTALNTLLKNPRQRLLVGDTTAVFWAEKESRLEEVFYDLFGEPPKDQKAQAESSQDLRQIVAMFRSPGTGSRPELDPQTRFHVLGLAPNAARLAIRFWYAGTVGEVADHINQHFDDLEMDRPSKQPPYLSLLRLLVATAGQGKSENIPPNLAGDFMKAILDGTPYPKTLLSAAVRRCRAEREITYPRASLIKAVLVRDRRFYNKSEEEVGMSLDTENTNIGYRLGRLFSVLEKIQEEANPGINATIRDRFYGSASGTPVTSFPHLMKLKNHHLAKLENRGRAVNLERMIGEIMDGIDDFPAHLSLQDQGRFAVGYYHQRQDFFTKKSQ